MTVVVAIILAVGALIEWDLQRAREERRAFWAEAMNTLHVLVEAQVVGTDEGDEE